MVLWLKRNKWQLLFALFVSLFFLYPYLIRDFLPIEHDTHFHLSRIEGLAEAFSRQDYAPAIYPYKNNSFGYASPLFYSDFFLIPAALLYMSGVNLAFCYKFVIFYMTFFSCLSMERLLSRFTEKQSSIFLVTFAYLFCNYRITDVYVRGALGETCAMIFIPMILSGLYDLFVLEKYNHIYLFGIAGLALSHNLSFLFGVCLVSGICLWFLPKFNKHKIFHFLKETIYAFFLTAFFTLPMLEQTSSQTLYLHYGALYTQLEAYSVPLWKYFANKTVFGFGNREFDASLSMLVNLGYFLSFVPILYVVVPKKKKNPFASFCLILGYVLYLLPLDFIPWQYLSFLRIIQFPWRFVGIAMPLLCIPIVVLLDAFHFKKQNLLTYLCLLCLAGEAIYHLQPVLTRTYGITSKTSYNELLDGSIVDPYFSATYVRIELAGADYLPPTSPDFREYTRTIKNSNLEDLPINYIKEGTTLKFSIPQENIGNWIYLPLTYYKGYQVYQMKENTQVPLETLLSPNGMVMFQPTESGNYICIYEGTPLLHQARRISLYSIPIIIGIEVLLWFYNKKKQPQL